MVAAVAAVARQRHPRTVADMDTRTPARAAAVTTSAGTAMLAYAWLEARWYRLQHLHLPGVLAAGTPPMRVLHLSDLHLSRRHGRMDDFLAGLAEEPYDLVVATGDLLGDVRMEQQVVASLAPLTADGRPGLAVLGSNDYWAPTPRNPFRYFTGPSREESPRGHRLDTDQLVAGLDRSGWSVLDDEATTIATPAGPVAVSAIHDPHLPGRPMPTTDTLRPPDEPGVGSPTLHLGLVHAPYLEALDLLADVGCDLVMAGHTHGGQVRMPGVGALVDNCDLPLDQARGASTHRGVPLHVSAGLGTSRYAPIRFACRPEATLLTLLP